jgi:AraC-like DNA-binding protein
MTRLLQPNGARSSVVIHPALAPYVREISIHPQPSLQGSALGSIASSYRVLPGLAPVIGFQFCGRLSVRRDGRLQLLGRSGITGFQSTVRWFVPEAETRSIIVRLAPFGGYILLGQAMDEIADQHVALDHLLPGVGSIEDELQALESRQTVERIQSWLLQRVASRTRDVDPDVVAALRLMTATGGRERIGVISKEIGTYRRRLERLFKVQVGVGPKEFASLMRFNQVIREVGQSSWADIALDAGYADQAHFIRDFKRRTGMTPTEFRCRKDD